MDTQTALAWMTFCFASLAVASMQQAGSPVNRDRDDPKARMVRNLAIRERAVEPRRRQTANERIKAKAAQLGFVDGKRV